MWTIASTGDGWNYIRNRWQTGEWVHLENLLGYAQYSGPQTGWYSAMWQFVNPTTVSSATAPATVGGTSANLDQAVNAGDNAAIRIFPDPVRAGSRFTITLPGNEQAFVTITDLAGKVVLVTRLSATGEIDPGVPAGVYFVTIRWKAITITKKLVVQ
jgi:hypothetical protein